MKRRRLSVVGIDISERAVRWVELKRRRGRIIVSSVGSRQFSPTSAEVLDTTFDEEIGEVIAEVLATAIDPGASVAVSFDQARVDISLRHLGTALDDDEIDFHARRMGSGGTAPANATEGPIEYRVIGCCPFEPGLLDVLIVTSRHRSVRRLRRLVRDAGHRLEVVDVDALVVARSMAGATRPLIVLCRGSTTEGFLIDPARHGVPASPCRLLDPDESVGASAYRSKSARVRELDRGFVEACGIDVVSLDPATSDTRVGDAWTGIDPAPAQAGVALLLALGLRDWDRLS